MRIGILGGSFNPIHNGHLAIARGMIKRAIVDKVMLMVSPQNPIKSPESLLPEDIRFLLAQKACESECGIQVSNFEFFLPRPSYTWQTLCALRSTHPENEYVLLIGADNWNIFSKWYRSKDIIENFEIAIYPREGFDISPASLPQGVKYVSMPLYKISSTDIRKKLSQGKDISAYVPQTLLKDITNLYKEFK